MADNLQALKDRNETLFYRFITGSRGGVGACDLYTHGWRACLNYSRFQKIEDVFHSEKETDVGHMHSMAYNWRGDVIVVVTDGSRVLGFGRFRRARDGDFDRKVGFVRRRRRLIHRKFTCVFGRRSE